MNEYLDVRQNKAKYWTTHTTADVILGWIPKTNSAHTCQQSERLVATTFSLFSVHL